MKNSMEIPSSVKEAAKFLIKMYGDNMGYLGKYHNSDVYTFIFPNNTETGFPFLYLYNPNIDSTIEITGPEALDIIGRV